MHLADRKARARATARRAPRPGQRGSRRWRHYRRRQRLAEARHRRRVRQAQHEAAKTVIAWAVARRVGSLAVGDPRGVLKLDAGRRHNQRTRDWRIGHLITVLKDKAEAAGIGLTLVDERGTSSTCPACHSRLASRTAAPGRIFLVSPPRDVTRAAAPITAALGGPLAGTGPPAPAPPGWPRSRSPPGEEP